MFFKQVRRNAAWNRRGNGFFFGSLVIAVVAFYTLLSLGEQDVMEFLATIESDAVRKLLKLIPFVYVVSLFFVFFLVYFACKYQMDARRREFGMYFMLGMKRSRLFFMLFCETLWSSRKRRFLDGLRLRGRAAFLHADHLHSVRKNGTGEVSTHG